jgi:hypothetical protein
MKQKRANRVVTEKKRTVTAVAAKGDRGLVAQINRACSLPAILFGGARPRIPPAMKPAGVFLWTLAVAHFIVSGAWFVGVLAFADRVVWFLSGALGFKDMVTILVLLTLALRYARHRHNAIGAVVKFVDALQRTLYGTIIFAALVTLGGAAYYAASLGVSITDPGGASTAAARRIAAELWTTEQDICIVVFVLLSVTGALHLLTLIWAGIGLAKKPCCCCSDADADADADADSAVLVKI